MPPFAGTSEAEPPVQVAEGQEGEEAEAPGALAEDDKGVEIEVTPAGKATRRLINQRAPYRRDDVYVAPRQRWY